MESIVTMGLKPDRDKNRGRGPAQKPAGFTAGADAFTDPAIKPAGGTVPGYMPAAGAVVNDRDRKTGALQAQEQVQAQKQEAVKKQQRQEEKQRQEEERRLLDLRSRQLRLVSKYVIATVVICYVLLRMVGNINTVIGAAGKCAATVGMLLMPLFWGFVLAYVLSPAVDACESRLRQVSFIKTRKRRHTCAVAVTCVLTLLVVGVLCSIVVSALTRSLKVASLNDLVAMARDFARTLGSFQESLKERLAQMNISSKEIKNAMVEIGQRIAAFTGGLSSGLTGTLGHIGGFLTGLLFAVIFAVYFMLDGRSLRRYWYRVLYAAGGKNARREFHILAKDADAVFSGYIRGQLIDALIMAVLVSAALSLVGVQYAVIIGILSGLGNLIPYVGPVIAYGSTILVCLVGGDLRRLLVAIFAIFVIQTVDGNLINPKLLSNSIDVHPMLVIASLIVGGAVGGIVGMLFAVPVGAFLKIQFDKVIDALLAVRRAGKASSGRTKGAGKASSGNGIAQESEKASSGNGSERRLEKVSSGNGSGRGTRKASSGNGSGRGTRKASSGNGIARGSGKASSGNGIARGAGKTSSRKRSGGKRRHSS